MSAMQACISKGFRFYSNINKIIPFRLLHQQNNYSWPANTNHTLHSRLLKHLDSAISKTNKNSELTTATHSIIPVQKKATDKTNNLKTVQKKPSVRTNNRSLVQKKVTDEINEQNPQNSQDDNICLILRHIDNLSRDIGHIGEQRQLDIIEKEICKVVHLLSSKQLLLILNRMMVVIPWKLAVLTSYKKAILRLRDMLSKGSPEPQEIVNYLLIASLPKKLGSRNVTAVLDHLPDLKSLSLLEQSVVALATFKTAVKLSREQLRVIENTIQCNIDCLLEDEGIFVSLLKALRYGGPSPEFNIDPLSEKILAHKSQFKISMAVPILALYAELFDPVYPVVRRLVGDSIADINNQNKKAENSEPPDTIRIKDVNRLLWATSRLNEKMTEEELKEIEQFVEENLWSNKCTVSKKPTTLCGTLLYLWMLKSPNHREMAEYCLRTELFVPILGMKKTDTGRINLLIECIQIEAPEIRIPPVFLQPIIPKPMKDCRELITVHELIKCLESHLQLHDTQIDCPIKSIRFYGITAKHKKLGLVHIDILNNTTCLKDTDRPNGLMALKLRLVKAMGFFSILLRDDGVINIESMIATIEKYISAESNKLKD